MVVQDIWTQIVLYIIFLLEIVYLETSCRYTVEKQNIINTCIIYTNLGTHDIYQKQSKNHLITYNHHTTYLLKHCKKFLELIL